jgi:hypothetical protein
MAGGAALDARGGAEVVVASGGSEISLRDAIQVPTMFGTQRPDEDLASAYFAGRDRGSLRALPRLPSDWSGNCATRNATSGGGYEKSQR